MMGKFKVLLQPRKVSNNFQVPRNKTVKLKVEKYQESKTIDKKLVNHALLIDCGYYYPVPYCYTSDFSVIK